jgi:dihydroorotate dehydrogenase
MASLSVRGIKGSTIGFRAFRHFNSRPVLRLPIPIQPRRLVSTSAAEASSLVTRLKNLLYGTSLVLFLGFSYLYATDTRAGIHRWLIVPSLRLLYPDAEAAHEAGTKALKALYASNLHIRERGNEDEKGDLAVTVFGHTLNNPIGTSAGIDKHAEIPDALLALGGAVVEVGGATPYPQDGNPKPRVFRLPGQKALINRYGLNSLGAEDMAMRLRERVRLFAYHNGIGIDEEAEDFVLNGHAGVPPGSLTPGKLLLVQIAKNKFTPEGDIAAVKRDYVFCVEQLGKYADVLVVNVSSPNTPGLRDLQAVGPLTELLSGVVEAAAKTERKERPRVMVKVSPDEDDDLQMRGIAEAVWLSGVDGVIVGNTTKRRDGLVPAGHKLSWKEEQLLQEQGGYSGPQMYERTLLLVKRYRQLLDQEVPPSADIPAKNAPFGTERKVIFATGGITNGAEALGVLQAGASVAMIYTALIYGGVGTISKMKAEMRDMIHGQ